MRQTPRRIPGFRGRAAPPIVMRPSPAPRPQPVNVYALGHVVLRWVEKRGRFVCLSGYDDRGIPKAAGFIWDSEARHWYTEDPVRAARLAQFADLETLRILKPSASRIDESALAASRATSADIDIPAPKGLSYMPFQLAGIAYALERLGLLEGKAPEVNGVLIGDAMGLGKTIQALGFLNAVDDPFPCLIVCPASLKINWRREVEKWLIHACLPMLAGNWFPIGSELVITNFERLQKHERAIASKKWKTLIVDEAHFLKNDETIRSKQVYAINAERKLFLTGTPIPNRVKEIYPLLAFLAPKVFGDRKKFMGKYGDASPSTPHGQAALNEFQILVRSTCMVRRLKEEVLTDLPPKVRQVIEFGGEAARAQVEKEQAAFAAKEEQLFTLKLAAELAKASDDPEVYKAAVKALKDGVGAAFGEMSKLRHDTALAKVPLIIEHVRDVLAEGSKLILFAHHHDVIDAYTTAFAKLAVKLTGEDTLLQRDAAVQAFQKGDKRLFVGSIQAAGVGLTLTASSHVAFAELDWVPGNMTQAEDRAHRIGQKDSVLVQHLVLEGSLDANMAKTLVAKQEVIDAALDSERGEMAAEPLVPTLDAPATEGATKEAIAREASRLFPEDIDAIHARLKELATAEMGRLDAGLVKSLASERRLTAKQAALGRRILRKYTKEQSE